MSKRILTHRTHKAYRQQLSLVCAATFNKVSYFTKELGLDEIGWLCCINYSVIDNQREELEIVTCNFTDPNCSRTSDSVDYDQKYARIPFTSTIFGLTDASVDYDSGLLVTSFDGARNGCTESFVAIYAAKVFAEELKKQFPNEAISFDFDVLENDEIDRLAHLLL